MATLSSCRLCTTIYNCWRIKQKRIFNFCSRIMQKTHKIITIIILVMVVYAIISNCIIYSRACFQPKKFDIASFFNDYQVPFSSDKISYSLLISCEQRPIVLSSFSMRPQAWQAFKKGFLMPDNSIKKEDTLQQNSLLPQYIQFQRLGNSIYLYDIKKNQCRPIIL